MNKYQAQNDMLIALYGLIAEEPFSEVQPARQHDLVEVLATALAVQSTHGRTDEPTIPIDQAH